MKLDSQAYIRHCLEMAVSIEETGRTTVTFEDFDRNARKNGWVSGALLAMGKHQGWFAEINRWSSLANPSGRMIQLTPEILGIINNAKDNRNVA